MATPLDTPPELQKGNGHSTGWPKSDGRVCVMTGSIFDHRPNKIATSHRTACPGFVPGVYNLTKDAAVRLREASTLVPSGSAEPADEPSARYVGDADGGV